nr:AMP-binding protein [uncultured Cupriavidus sp.]
MTMPPEKQATVPLARLSHVQGDSTLPLSEQTIPALLAQTVARHGQRLAVVFREQGIRWSWEEFSAAVDAMAAGLHAIGLRRGERIGIWSPNRVEWVVTQFATARLGLVLVNINPAYRVAELEYALNKVACVAIVAPEAFKSSRYLDMLQSLAPELSKSVPGQLKAARLPALRWVIRMEDTPTPGMLTCRELAERGNGVSIGQIDAMSEALDSHDPINIQFTSGTTGAPKGATLTHRNVVNNARYVGAAMNFAETDRLCVPVPLYHCFGMVMSALVCAGTGACMVFPGEAFDPLATMAAISEERCTAVHGVPTMFIAQLDHPQFRDFDFSTLRTGIMAGAPCPIEIMKRVVADMNMQEVTIAYGMTETSPVSFQSAADDPLVRRVATVGRVQPHLECKIVDTDGHTVEVGATGELCIRGYSVMLGYWEDEQRTRESIRDGWMHTGDLATIDAEGYCNIVGRVKDMLIRGGENVYPREIEEFLFRHPKVQSVQVFGVPDPKYGEEICAWIVLRPGETATEVDIREFCRDQIAHYKIPRYIRFVDEMPMTITGKVQKFAMRETMVRELNLGENKTA